MLAERRNGGLADGRPPRGMAGHRRCLWIALVLPLLVAGCAGDGSDGDAEAGGDDFVPANVQSSQLMGLAPDQVTGMLGPADFRRDDGPAQILQYRSPTCVLDLYLYRDTGGADFHVTYIEARDRSLGQLAAQTCLASVVRSKRIGHVSG